MSPRLGPRLSPAPDWSSGWTRVYSARQVEDGKDKEEPSWKHKEHQDRQEDGKEERKGGVNVFQPNDRDIPEQKDKTEENQTSKNQEPDENSLPGFDIQRPLLNN